MIDDFHELSGSPPAENFVESLLIDAPLNVLLLTRQRPKWASSRRILYGEIFELNRSLLAMSDREAAALLGVRSGETSELVALAKGWPAVLALAAVFDEAPPDLMGAPHLHSFFADEIYRRLDRKTRQRLAELALYGIEGRQLALQQMQIDHAQRVVATGIVLRLSHRTRRRPAGRPSACANFPPPKASRGAPASTSRDCGSSSANSPQAPAVGRGVFLDRTVRTRRSTRCAGRGVA